MAKVLVTGIRKVDFEDDKGRPVKGTSIYYKSNLAPSTAGLFAAGFMTDKVWLKDGSDLEKRMCSVSYEKPFEADLRYDILPNSKRPTLIDIVF